MALTDSLPYANTDHTENELDTGYGRFTIGEMQRFFDTIAPADWKGPISAVWAPAPSLAGRTAMLAMASIEFMTGSKATVEMRVGEDGPRSSGIFLYIKADGYYAAVGA